MDKRIELLDEKQTLQRSWRTLAWEAEALAAEAVAAGMVEHAEEATYLAQECETFAALPPPDMKDEPRAAVARGAGDSDESRAPAAVPGGVEVDDSQDKKEPQRPGVPEHRQQARPEGSSRAKTLAETLATRGRVAATREDERPTRRWPWALRPGSVELGRPISASRAQGPTFSSPLSPSPTDRPQKQVQLQSGALSQALPL